MGKADDETVQSSLSGETEDIDRDEIIVSAHVGRNAEVFSKILDLHVPRGAKVADVTYGKGVFWKRVSPDAYDVYGTDLDDSKSPTGDSVDARDAYEYWDERDELPFDCVVLDPPYAEGFFRRNKEMLAGGDGSHSNFRKHYSSGDVVDTRGSKYHQAVLDLYCAAGTEAKRMLTDDGTLIVKVQDEVSANTQELTHIQITNFFERELDLYTKDLFTVVRSNKPAVSGMHNQVHARKNHSYFMIYEMDGTPTNRLR